MNRFTRSDPGIRDGVFSIGMVCHFCPDLKMQFGYVANDHRVFWADYNAGRVRIRAEIEIKHYLFARSNEYCCKQAIC